MSGGYDSIVPITRPIVSKSHYDRMTPEQKVKAAESYFLSVYLTQIYKAQSSFEDEELNDPNDEPIMDTDTQFDMVQQQYVQVLSDEFARKNVLGLDKVLGKSIHSETGR